MHPGQQQGNIKRKREARAYAIYRLIPCINSFQLKAENL